MVSKYKLQGYLALGEKRRIDPVQSLANLKGILDDGLHAIATQKLQAIPETAPTATLAATQERNARQEKDHWQSQLAALKYAREAGQVCDTSAVDNAATIAVHELQQALTQTVQDAAKDIAKNFGIHADKIPILRRLLSIVMVEKALQNFSDAMTHLAATAALDTKGKAAAIQYQPDFALMQDNAG